ncbi:hypothetical protein FQR65_LT04083 [Abscondita terminalis]|nr:hypothetical protein FQR65_LT04083 [Abscondita terminalis]
MISIEELAKITPVNPPIVNKKMNPNAQSIWVEIRVDDVLKIEGGGLTKDYTFDHLHFHWASEHTIDGFRFPLEMHFVHYATRYKNLGNALNFDDGVAVLGVFAHMSPDDDIEFEAFTKVLEHIENNHNSFHMDDETIMRNFLPRDVAGFIVTMDH